MRKWNEVRKLKNTALAVKSIVRFQLAGARHRKAILSAARHARQLEKDGISWKLTAGEIEEEMKRSMSKASSKMKNLIELDASNIQNAPTVNMST
jgi:hypothetical protein